MACIVVLRFQVLSLLIYWRYQEIPSRLYLTSSPPCWSLKYHFEKRVLQQQRLFAKQKNIEVFSMGISERDNGYCVFSECWVQSEIPGLLCSPKSLVLSHCRSLALRRSADDQIVSGQWRWPYLRKWQVQCLVLTPGTDPIRANIRIVRCSIVWRAVCRLDYGLSFLTL